MIPITTSSSMSVKPEVSRLCQIAPASQEGRKSAPGS